ncbi:MAG: hypothetical protein OEZ21_11365 [Candidatus Bathyarchaeota archaeon]|nr:hypothetical protein [Candidatus Bathyarchaeota archaeon]MDH5747530.1 hypothetical protein [Candidatus Bathyarchaeota archaeon]
MQNSGGASFTSSVLLSIPMLVVFAYFQILALDNQHFLLLTFSSYAFLAGGIALLFSTVGRAAVRTCRIFVNIVVLIFVVTILVAAYSLATIPRGGVMHTYYASPNGFSMNLQAHGAAGRYSGGNYPEETIVVADYPVGWVLAFASWDFSFSFSTDKPINLTGTLYSALLFESNPGTFYQTVSEPVAFVNETSVSVDIRPEFWGWGGHDPNIHRVRIEGYRLKLWVSLWLEGGDYGPELNFAVQPHGEVQVYDYVVDSQLQNTTAILLCGGFAAIVCYNPARQIRHKIKVKTAPIIKNLNEKWAKPEEHRSFFKACVQCGREIPIASQLCPYCNEEQRSKPLND